MGSNKKVQSTIGDKIVETLYLNRVTSENKRIHTPPLSPPFKVGVFVENNGTTLHGGDGGGKLYFLLLKLKNVKKPSFG